MTILTPEERAELRKLAEAATHGPWESVPDQLPRVLPMNAPGSRQVRSVDNTLSSVFGHRILVPHGFLHESDADFIAAANPATVLSLLDALDAKDAELGSVRALNEAERWVVNAAMLEYHERPDTIGTDLHVAVDALLALRKDQTDGD